MRPPATKVNRWRKHRWHPKTERRDDAPCPCYRTMKTAIRIAWREARASRAKFLFVILAVAAGVACLTGVKGFTRVFQTMLSREARTLMAGDLMIRTFSLPTHEQQDLFDHLEKEGVRRTWITETVTMLSKASDAPPVLISVKAIDPKVYPFYGAVK